MKKGVNGWTFPAGTTWAAAAKAARAAGFEALEPTIGPDGELTVTTDEATCRRIGNEIRDAGLVVASVACGLFWETHYTSPDPTVREGAHDLTVGCLDRAKWLGAPALLVVPGVVAHFERPRRPVIGYAEALKLAYDALQTLSFEAEARGVVIAVENVWNQFLLSPVEFRELIDRVNSPWVRVYFDVGNVLKFGFPQDWIQTLGSRIQCVHLKDFRIEVGNINGFCPLGEGDADWPAILAALRRHNYDGVLTYEGPGDLADISRRIDRILASVPE